MILQNELTAKLRERAVREPPVGKAADSPRQSPVLQGHVENAIQSRKHPTSKLVSHNAEMLNKRPSKKMLFVGDNKLPSRNGAIKAGQQNGHATNGCYNGRIIPRESNARRADHESEVSKNYVKSPSPNDLSQKYSHEVTESKEPELHK